jgi:hypothetical protein
MATLGELDERKAGERVYYCEKHGVFNRLVDANGSISEIVKHPRRLRSD